MRKEIGTALFIRTNQGVTLTDAGKSLYKDAKKIITWSDEAIMRAREAGGFSSRTIRIWTSILRPAKPLLDRYNQKYDPSQDFEIELVPFDDSPDGLTKMLKSLGKTLDCFVSPSSSYQWDDTFHTLVLRKMACELYVPKSHRLSTNTSLTWDDLSNESILLVKEGTSPVIDAIREEIKREHPDIHVLDAPSYYDTAAFNYCIKNGYLMEMPGYLGQRPSFLYANSNGNGTIPWDYGVVYVKHPRKEFVQFLDVD